MYYDYNIKNGKTNLTNLNIQYKDDIQIEDEILLGKYFLKHSIKQIRSGAFPGHPGS